MKSLNCNQIKIFINLEIIGEEGKKIYIYIYILNLQKFLQFNKVTCRNHSF